MVCQKIHNEEIPLRPIVNTIGSPTYNLAKWLASNLKGYVGQTDSHIKDSASWIR